MAQNPNRSLQDWQQALGQSIDALNDALRVQIADTSGMAVELSSADGDSVSSMAGETSQTGTVTVATAGTLVAALDISMYREFQLLVDVGAGITGTCTVSIEFSPQASGTVWIPSGTTLAITGSTNLLSAKNTSIGMRARVVVSGSNTISAGTATIYMLARS